MIVALAALAYFVPAAFFLGMVMASWSLEPETMPKMRPSLALAIVLVAWPVFAVLLGQCVADAYRKARVSSRAARR